MKNKKKGFSLIELSVVVLIIGLLIAAVIGGRKLVTISNISKAKALTNSSPVAGIENLVAWYETISRNSFTFSPTDGSAISTWKDINPQKTIKNDIAAGNAPTYTENAINGLPALKFDGINDYLVNANGNIANGSELTIFAVLNRISQTTDFLGWLSMTPAGQVNDNDNNASISFDDGIAVTLPFLRYYRNGSDNVFTHPGNNKSFIYSTVFNGTNNNSFLNGVASTSNPATTTGNFTLQNIIVGARWSGSAATLFWNGYIAEIIVFDRALSDFERQQIEQYLSKKWSIKLT